MPDSTPLDAHQINRELRVLAAHLEQAGVAFLPVANAKEVETWSQRFETRPDPLEPGQPDSSQPDSSQPEPSQPEPSQPAHLTPQNANPSESDVRSTEPRPPSRDPESPKVKAPPRSQANSTSDSGPTVSISGSYAMPILPREDRQTGMSSLAQSVAQCHQCEILSSCRKNTVFGEGNLHARFVFFGEGPGADEDRMGRPFVGRSGELLTKMIAAMTLDRNDVYIMNTVKCRPPGNRNPEPDELSHCRAYYQAQLEHIQPEYIICLGGVAAQELLQVIMPVGMLREKFHSYHTSKVLVTYHPSYLLRNQLAKKAAWADLQRLMVDAGLKNSVG